MSERLKWLLVGCLVFIPAVTSAQTTNPLDEIIAQVKTGFRQQSRPTVIFDVDGTILDIRPRVLKIVHEYAREELQKVRPQLSEQVLKMDVADIQYAIADTLKNGGINEDALITNGSIFGQSGSFPPNTLSMMSLIRASWSSSENSTPAVPASFTSLGETSLDSWKAPSACSRNLGFQSASKAPSSS